MALNIVNGLPLNPIENMTQNEAQKVDKSIENPIFH